MTADEYINQQPEGRQAIMRALHAAIINHDRSVEPVIEQMMGKEMIVYKERCYMKYALSGVKNYMSVHCMPMYMNPPLHAQYSALMPGAKFQKGCFNFSSAEDMPINVARSLFTACSAISIADVLEKRKKK
jgi:glycine/serine hydroxymethyltransferase